jgi:hypothetical protein
VRRRGGDNRAGWRWRRMGVFELQPPGAVYSRRSVARAAKRIIRVARNRPRTPEGKEAARHHGEEAVSCERTGASGQAGKAGFLQPSGRNAGQRRGRLLAETQRASPPAAVRSVVSTQHATVAFHGSNCSARTATGRGSA